MLVLSRRPDEKIVLPSVPVLIKVISSQTNLVRLGLEAPSHVPILREELTRNDRGLASSVAEAIGSDPRSPRYDTFVRNRLNNLHLGLTLLRMHLVDGDPVVRKTLDGLEEELLALGAHLTGNTSPESISEEIPVSVS